MCGSAVLRLTRSLRLLLLRQTASLADPLGSKYVGLDKAAIHEKRKGYFCQAQSVSYANSDPLMVVRGNGSKLYDEAGREYLDTR